MFFPLGDDNRARTTTPVVVYLLVAVNAVTTVPAGVFRNGQATVRYLVVSDQGFRKEIEFLLLGPYREGE